MARTHACVFSSSLDSLSLMSGRHDEQWTCYSWELDLVLRPWIGRCQSGSMGGCLELLHVFFSSVPRFLAKRFQLYALSSRKKSGAVRAPKEVLHKLQFFMELFHGEVCGAVPGTAPLHVFQLRFTFFSQTVLAPRTQFEEKEWSCESI